MTVEREAPVRRPRPRAPLPVKTDEEFEQAPENQPRGVATAIIFDWSLAIYFGALLLIAVVQRGINSQQAASAAILALVIGLPITLLGELIRRGKHWARMIQISVSVLLGAINLFGFIRDLSFLLQGIRPVAFNVAALIAGSTIVWGLTRPQTIAWFERSTSTQARKRHGGSWLLFALTVSVVFGTFWSISSLQ